MGYHYAKTRSYVTVRDWASGMLFVGLILAAAVISMAAMAPTALLTQVSAGVLVLYVAVCTYVLGSNRFLK